MSQQAVPDPAAPGAPARIGDPGLAFRPFVTLLACLMAINALGIDSMLAALPAIGRALRVPSENERQLIIAVYMFGFGGAQVVWGPLADRFGRKPIVAASMALFACLSLVAASAPSFPLLLAARLCQGIAASASRVLVVSIVRDCYSGRQMARVMSLTFIIFLAVPIFAPSVGQGIMLVTGSWRAIFGFLALFSAGVSIVAAARLRETLHPEYRQPLSYRNVLRAATRVLRNRYSIGYTIASAFTFGALMGFVNSVQQIFADIFRLPHLFPLVFAGMAVSMGLASTINARLVERVGARRISHAALLGFTAMSAIHFAVAAAGRETVWTFAPLQALTMFCFGMIGANFNSMAMEPVGDIAGTASSVQGFLSTCLGAALGLAIGQSFNATTVPLTAGFALLGLAAIGVVLTTERGRLFRPQHAVPA